MDCHIGLDHLYQNSAGIERESSPVYTNTFEGEQSFANYDKFKNNCSCDTPQGTGEFCTFCGGVSDVAFNLATSSTPFSHEDKYIFGSLKRRPRITKRRCNSLSNLSPDGLYTQIPLITNSIGDINPLELQHFAETFQLPLPENLDIVIDRPLNIAREIEPVRVNEPEIHRQIQPEVADLAHNPVIENIYDDVFKMDNFARLHSLRPPKFNSQISNVRTFFSKFDKFANIVQPPWNNEVKIAMLSNLLEDFSPILIL